nr:uncharacterized protein LOC129422607 [Misgurnus anguillicaudatus]
MQALFGDYQSFEYLCIALKGTPRILFTIIYRPPKYTSAFVDEFTELLSTISSAFDYFVIAGDLNIDNAENNTAIELLNVLNNFDLTQHVQGPTHTRGHTLDLLISKGLNISSIVIKDEVLSDHFCVYFDLLICPATDARFINENTSEVFMNVISMLPNISADSVDVLLENFNIKVKDAIAGIAPVKVRMITGRRKAPWRNTKPVQRMKRTCRKAERMWRKTKLEVHYSIYKDSLRAFNVELGTARQTFFSNIINQVPSEMLSDNKCNEFATFFSEKISNIRMGINTPSYCTVVCQISFQQPQKLVILSDLGRNRTTP